jgi:hypothetical protein
MLRTLNNNLQLRIITQHYQGREHTFKNVDSRVPGGYQHQYVRCAGKNCPMCVAGFYSRIFFVVGAIDRADNNYHLFKHSQHEFSLLRKLYTNLAWGPLQDYDVIFTEVVYAGFNIKTTVKFALSARELDIQEKVDKNILESYIVPFPIDCVKGFMRRNGIQQIVKPTFAYEE